MTKHRPLHKTTLIAWTSALDELQSLYPALSPTWNRVDGKFFDAPLPDGKSVEVPESMKLPNEWRGHDQ